MSEIDAKSPTIVGAKNTRGTYGEDFGAQFQLHILAVAARVPTLAIKYRPVLDPAYWPSKAHRIIAKALLDHVDKYRALPTRTTLVQACKEVTDDKTLETIILPAIKQVYQKDISDAASVADRVIEFGRQSAMCNAVLTAAEQLTRGERKNVNNLIRDAQLVGQDLADVGLDYRTYDRLKLYGEESNDDRVPTGIPHLDLALGGGAIRGGLYVLLAPPKRGKTTFVINVGYGALLAAAGYGVVHYSHEINRTRVMMRYDQRLAGPHWKLRKTDPEQYARIIQDRAKHFIQGRMFIQSYPTRTCTVSMMRAHLMLLQSQGFPVDVIISDYADIMKPERRLGEMRHEQAGIYEDLRGVAGEFNAAMWTCSQAGKAALEKDTPTMADFSETFEKAHIMDAGIALAQNPDEVLTQRARLVMVGMRDEQDGTTVQCDIHRDRCKLISTALFDPAGTLISGDVNAPTPPKPGPTPSPNGKHINGKPKPSPIAKSKNPNAEDQLKNMNGAVAKPHKPKPSKRLVPLMQNAAPVGAN